MLEEVTVPKLGLVMDEVYLVEWLKELGEHAEEGELLFVLDIDKVAIEVESPVTGTLAKIIVENETQVEVGQVLGYIETG